ncbi:MAG: tRNA (adenosine(37)-N6)-threonylcarbamoyltransferase complex transferase subunit TsaD, partial [Patescibacteria group bacterium]
ESLSQSTNGQRSLVGASLTRDDKREVTRNDFCASVEQAIVDVLVAKTVRAAEQYKPKTIILAGGVSANKKLRETLEHEIKKQFPTINIQYPQLKYCMDNAAMIAVAGYYHALKKDFTDWKKIKADPNWELA